MPQHRKNYGPDHRPVDDDRNILTSVQMTLEAEGYAVRTFTDGEALQGLPPAR